MNEHLDYDGMKSAMVSMAKNIAKEGKINDGAKGAINGFLKTIRDTLLPALATDKQNAQAALDTAEAAVNKCNSDRGAWANNSDMTGLVGQNNKVDQEEKDHNDCRKQEQVTLDNYTSHCSTLQTRVCNWHNCPQPSFTAGDTDLVNDYICCVTEFFDDHRTAYYAELEACNTATSLHHAQVAKCDAEQATFQNQFCARENHIQQKCKWYDDCRCSTEAEFESVKSDVEDLEKIFQTQFVALKHLDCYGEKMLTEITDLSGCDNVGDDCEANYGASCPQIVYTDPADFLPCDEPHSNYPCQDAFKTEFYGWLDVDQPCTPIDDCDDSFCDNQDITDGTWTGGRKQGYASCTPSVGR